MNQLVYPNYHTLVVHSTRRCAQGSMKRGNQFGGFKAVRVTDEQYAKYFAGKQTVKFKGAEWHICQRCTKGDQA